MTILALDTSAIESSIALFSDDGATTSARVSDSATHSLAVPRLVEQIFRESGTEPRSLSLLLCGAGPGSFTGLRIGLSVFKGLSLAHNVPLQMLSSLEAAAYPYRNQASVVASVADARRDELFLELYSVSDGRLERDRQAPAIVPKAELLLHVDRLSRERCVDPELALIVAEQVPADVSWHARCILRQDVAASMIALWQSRHNDVPAYSLTELSQIEPSYVRRVSALTVAEREALPKK